MLPNNRQRRNHNTFDKYLDTNEKENLQKLTRGSKSGSKMDILRNAGLPQSTRKLSIDNLILNGKEVGGKKLSPQLVDIRKDQKGIWK